MKYLVTYDLKTPGQYYPILYAAIESLATDFRRMQNVWFIESTYTSAQMRDVLKTKVDSNDKVFVCAIGDWATYNMQDVASFLNS